MYAFIENLTDQELAKLYLDLEEINWFNVVINYQNYLTDHITESWQKRDLKDIMIFEMKDRFLKQNSRNKKIIIFGINSVM